MKKIISLVFFFVMTLSVSAVPAKRDTVSLKLPDGTTVMAFMVGDEFEHYWVNAETGLPIDKRKGNKLAAEKRKRANTMYAERAAKYRKANTLKDSKKGLIILVDFQDVKFRSSNNRQAFDDLVNKPGYSENGCAGSVRDYFKAQSYEQFDLSFDVVGPVTVSHNSVYYGGNDSNGNDSHPGEMVGEACQLADPYVNYADYDWDGDGEVDQVYVIYAGRAEAVSHVEDDIWPHSWSLWGAYAHGDGPGYIQLDNIWVNSYACSSELNDSWSTRIMGVGTLCHEYSHCLGLMDMYDTVNNIADGMMHWSLMAAGNYNGNSGVPAGYTSYERACMGWLTPQELTDGVDIHDMPALTDEPVAYIVYNQANNNEFYMLENRQQKSWDASLYGHGLLVTHVDYNAQYWQVNQINADASHQRCAPICADNQSEYYSSEAGDTYPGTSNNHALTNTSTPAASLFNQNADGSYFMNKPIENITESNGLISFQFNGGGEAPEPVEPFVPEVGMSYTLKQVDADLYLNLSVAATEDSRYVGQTATPEEIVFEVAESGYKICNKAGQYLDVSTWNVEANATGTVWQIETVGEYIILKQSKYVNPNTQGSYLGVDNNQAGMCWYSDKLKSGAIRLIPTPVTEPTPVESWEPALPSGQLLSLSSTRVSNFETATSGADNDHWYMIVQKRDHDNQPDLAEGHETPLDGSTSTLKRTAKAKDVSTFNGQNVTDNAAYFVRFIASETDGLYNIQFGNGKFIASNLAVGETKGNFAFYPIQNNTEGHFGWNVNSKTGPRVDNNGASYTVVTWGSGEVTATGGNNDWYIYKVSFTDLLDAKQALLEKYEHYVFGYDLGEYNFGSDDYDFESAVEACTSLAELEALDAAVAINQPIVGGFYRIKSASSNRYVAANAAGQKLKMVENSDDSTIFCVDDQHRLINYSTGLGTVNTSYVAAVDETKETVTFSGSTIEPGQYCLQSNYFSSKYWTDGGDYLDRQGEETNLGVWHLQEVYVLPVKLTAVGDVCYTTLYLPMGVLVPDFIEVYTAENNVVPNSLLVQKQGQIVPPYTGVILSSTVTEATVSLGYTDQVMNSVLSGKIGMEMATDNDFVFSKKAGTEKVGFYKLPNTVTTLKGFRAYYKRLDDQQSFVDIDWGHTTGVTNRLSVLQKEEIFDLQGRKVKTAAHGGLYIVNGKKILK